MRRIVFKKMKTGTKRCTFAFKEPLMKTWGLTILILVLAMIVGCLSVSAQDAAAGKAV